MLIQILLLLLLFEKRNNVNSCYIPGYKRKNPLLDPKNCHERPGSKAKLFLKNGIKDSDHLMSLTISGAFYKLMHKKQAIL